MDFSIDSEFPIVLGKKTSKIEGKIKNDILCSKLAYLEVSSLNRPQIRVLDASEFKYYKEDDIEIIKVPFLTNDTRMASYFLRIAVDANAVKRGYLPLHAAAYVENGVVKFLFGDTHKGKSLALDMLLSNNSEIVPIGDDHIIVGRKSIFGNSITRNRQNGKDIYSFFKKDLLSYMEDYEIILIDVTGENESSEIMSGDVLKNNEIENSTLKYLIKQPAEEGSRILHRNLVEEDVISSYKKRYENFLLRARSIRILSGCKEYLLEEMSK